MGIELASLMPGAVAVITLAAFFTSMVTAMVGAGGGTALLLVMLYVMPASQVVPVHGGIQLVSNLTRVVLFWRHMHWPAILRFVIPMPAGVWLGLQLYGMLSAGRAAAGNRRLLLRRQAFRAGSILWVASSSVPAIFWSAFWPPSLARS